MVTAIIKSLERIFISLLQTFSDRYFLMFVNLSNFRSFIPLRL
ncbi:hypothetical protein ACE1CI_10795 [Aerosakkonemataceae cyanobacterium BLCC-F50]|uniref:Uncharacterized protein n=1 Tax=Floridaenema flaviceps BLCC-F50 TaxID=3153642 RepID=A0ABV4XPC8_9CYAN